MIQLLRAHRSAIRSSRSVSVCAGTTTVVFGEWSCKGEVGTIGEQAERAPAVPPQHQHVPIGRAPFGYEVEEPIQRLRVGRRALGLAPRPFAHDAAPHVGLEPAIEWTATLTFPRFGPSAA